MYKIVQFRDGLYGIRKLTMLGYRFWDVTSPTFWHSNKSVFFKDCKTSNLHYLNEYLRLKANNDYGVPI